jgi:hypothetical protein
MGQLPDPVELIHAQQQIWRGAGAEMIGGTDHSRPSEQYGGVFDCCFGSDGCDCKLSCDPN